MTLDQQLADDLHVIVGGLGALLGLDVEELLDRRVDEMVPMLAGQLTGDDDRLAAQTVIDLAGAGIIPDDPDLDWWATPLGRVVACSVGHPSAEVVTRSVAAAMLGVSDGTVSQLVARGALDRVDGKILAVSVQQRLQRGDGRRKP